MALEWLKGILGDAYTEDADKKISDEIGKGFVARPDFNALNEAKKGFEEQLKTANDTISGFKDMDIDGIKAESEKYKAAAAKAEQDAAEKIAAMQFDTALDGAIGAAKAKNAKAVKALLDVDALRASKNQTEDIK
ncbi:MAG: phage scaffolding protein, partial [Ruthenibacterium sp.]